MKNIQVIDSGDNCTYDIFSIDDDDFDALFPDGQDVEFIEDVFERLKEDKAIKILQKLWGKRVDKKNVSGIHGTLFYQLAFKKEFYPSKKESEMIVKIPGSELES
jgi:hypothetical protein